MPDITMCTGGNCPYKETCYRFTATPSDYQSYFTTFPIKIDVSVGSQRIFYECDHWIEVEK